MSKNYDLKSESGNEITAPDLPYQPPAPVGLVPKIGLIGCGGITEHHLKAYRVAGWEVVAFFDPLRGNAEKRRDEFYPDAKVCGSPEELLGINEIGIVDIATHPVPRVLLIEQAIAAGKHILSQKPFVNDLATGERLVKLAHDAGVRLAVNQNGRWSPYFSYMRHAVKAGIIGEVGSVHMVLNWDHSWTAGTPFEQIHHLILEDFGIHWFDACRSFFRGQSAASVSASVASFPAQPLQPPMLASAAVNFPSGMATLAFNGCSRLGARETCTIVGSEGTLHATGEICGIRDLELHTAQGIARVRLDGAWFPDGFRGTMGELMCAIGENREPENSAEDNLDTVALVHAAMESADSLKCVLLGCRLSR
jgi:predicted dehydrogenase